MLAALAAAFSLLNLVIGAPIGEFEENDDLSFYNKGIDFTDYDHQPSSISSNENLFAIHPKGESKPNEPSHIRDHMAAVDEKRRQLNGRHHGADFLFLSPTSAGGIHNPSHVLVPSSPTVRQLQDRTWQRANSHNPWFRIAWPQGASSGREPTRLGYDYKKGGYSWGGYGTFGAIDIWEEEEENSEEEEKDNEDDPFEKDSESSIKDQRSSVVSHAPSSIVPPLLPNLEH
ncbi:hypothetical protein PENTCL1PPCAC_13938, partial [Pristionchus entomophagus]